MPFTLYGIRNCDTMKKAFAWLDARGIGYTFHDYRRDGLDAGRLEAWSRQVGWEALINRAGTTFRKLPADERDGLTEERALRLMEAQPAMIRRPVLDLGDRLLVGFKPDLYAAAFDRGA